MLVAIAVAGVAGVLAAWIAPRWLAWGCRHLALRDLRRGAVSSAQRWLATARRLVPTDPCALVLEAACYRHLREARPFVQALEAAEKLGAPPKMIAQERTLGFIQAGRFDQAGYRQPAELLAEGFPPHELAGALVCGLLARGQPGEARKTLDAWAADFPDHPHVAYMWGTYWQWLGNPAKAELAGLLGAASAETSSASADRWPESHPASCRAELLGCVEGR